MFGRNRKAKLASRVIDEKLYDIIAAELNVGVKKDGLWLKALAKARGNDERAAAEYITLRMQSLIDEIEIASLQSQEKIEPQKVVTQHEMRCPTPLQKLVAKKHNTQFDDKAAQAVSLLESHDYTVTDKGYLIWRVTGPDSTQHVITGLPDLVEFARNLSNKHCQ